MHKILANTVFLGKDIIYMTECHSTNDIASAKIKDGTVKEGSIVLTDKQTKGRGQRGNRWYSEPGKNLTFSLVLAPVFLSPGAQFDLNRMISKAVKDALNRYADGIMVKWPNDIVHTTQGKLGGILIENSLTQSRIETSVVGIGLNLNQVDFALPGPVSLAVLSGRQVDKWELLNEILVEIEKRYIQVKKGRVDKLREEYWQDLYLREEWATYEDASGIYEGMITGITPEGRLIIKKKDGKVNQYAFKEVKFL
ncbi:biotin--[acetyl-CoA-carboxylase] ligase [Echinicola strongylocentroti]|uniref:biotin--[biotin carboxyl-carrier protein] ligase n=1 Tax=Echinicola strongylocentroti TaxID=1795355 RepID=A0A2Z4IMD7_9BACT|nr:biotin--[acetyl-CoA-carboxylase] ligase [Echinicola strongylocentroti]AWW31899.1 biotin--[acetyl-CoA-carboxylase] ligase [Echinicola strongylocentroti]